MKGRGGEGVNFRFRRCRGARPTIAALWFLRPSIGGKPFRVRKGRSRSFRREDDAETVGIEAIGGEGGFGHGEIGGGKAVLNFARHDFQTFTRADVSLGIEVGDLGADVDRKGAGVRNG